MTLFVTLAPINLPLVTRGVVIRALQADDVAALYDIETDPCVKRYLKGPVTTPRDDWIARLSGRCPTDLTLAVCDGVDGTFLGRAAMAQCLPHIERKVELEIVLGKAAWGRHLGRHVACALIEDAWRRNATAVVAKTHLCNAHARALLSALGFTPTDIVSSNKWVEFCLVRDAYSCS